MSTVFANYIDKYKENETKFNMGLFVLGFVVDLVTLSNIDNPWSLAQQAVYLFVMFLVLTSEALQIEVSEKWQKLWSYRAGVFHFFLGSLLSLYSLFYTKSASLASSLVFILMLVVLLIANETKYLKESGLKIKSVLFTLCLFSFFAILVPIVYGSIGLIPFFISSVFTLCFAVAFQRLLNRRLSEAAPKLFMGNALVVLFFCLSYLFKLIPPVPLSATHMGIYHEIEKSGEHYKLSHQRPFWKIWQTGDQEFWAQPGDKIYFFTQVFSPAAFKDQVWVKWEQHDARQGWMVTDRIPIQITGGRKEGYRGFTFKSNYSEGRYRIKLESADEREIGRISLEIKKLPEHSPRSFHTDYL